MKMPLAAKWEKEADNNPLTKGNHLLFDERSALTRPPTNAQRSEMNDQMDQVSEVESTEVGSNQPSTCLDQRWSGAPSAEDVLRVAAAVRRHPSFRGRVNGLQAHAILIHGESPEWTLGQSVKVLVLAHTGVHADGLSHRGTCSSRSDATQVPR